jgi:hypothetical protein
VLKHGVNAKVRLCLGWSIPCFNLKNLGSRLAAGQKGG